MSARPFGRIDRRDSGRYRIRYEVDGRTISGGTYPTKTAAAEALAAIRTDLRRGAWVDPAHGAVTFAEAFHTFIEHRQIIGKLRATTVPDYLSIGRNHLGIDGTRVTGFGRKRLGSITRPDVNALVTRLVRADRAPNTVRNVVRLVSAVLAYACDEQRWIVSNPAERVSMPRTDGDEMICLTEDQVLALAAAFPRPTHGTLIRLTVFGGGLRAGEVAGLRVGDFDPDAATITVARARRGGADTRTKTDASVRTNVLPGWLAVEVADLCAGRRPEAPLFTSTEGRPHEHGNWMRRWFKPTAARIGLPDGLRFHDLRHTGASLALARGIPVVNVARWLGHANPATTLGVYAHVLPDDHGRPAAAFETVRTTTLRAVS